MEEPIKSIFFKSLLLVALFLIHSNLLAQYSISGSVFYSDNDQPLTNDNVYILTYDPVSLCPIYIDSTNINSDGSYCLKTSYTDSVFLRVGIFDNERDHVPTYYPGTIDWEQATLIYPLDDPTGINIPVQRIQIQLGSGDLTGTITTTDTNSNTVPLSGALVVVAQDSVFKAASVTDSSGQFIMDSLSAGEFLVLANKIGYSSDSITVTLGGSSRSSAHAKLKLKRVNMRKTMHNNNVALNFHLGQNYPNPFNPSTKIRFSIPSNIRNVATEVKLVIYDLLGREIAKLVDENLLPGNYEVQWNAASIASGVYFYSLRAGNYSQIRKMVLLK